MKKQKLTAVILVAAMTFSSAFTLAGCGKEKDDTSSEFEFTTEAPKELSIPISSEDALEMNYEELYDLFRDAGFSEVRYNGLGDLSESSDSKNETIERITVDGNDTFSEGNKIMSNVEIKISYHSVKEITAPIDNDDIEGKNYEDIITQFETAGFTNVSTREVEDSSKTAGEVKEISINGETDFWSYTSYPCDSKVVISYYTKQKSESKSEESKTDKKDSSKKEGNSSLSDTVSQEFKKTMDSYEEFFDEYVSFMKKYEENPSDLGLLADYATFMSKYTDYIAKLSDIDYDSLSTADALYYTEVNARILKKLAEIGE